MFKTVLAGAVATAYILASHFALILPQGQKIAAALAIVVPAAVLCGGLAKLLALLFRRAFGKNTQPHWDAFFRAGAVCVALCLTASIAWWIWPIILHQAQALYFAQHVGMNALLAWVFGRTLQRGHTPLVVTFARWVHREIPPDIEAYAGRVTVAWTLFFALSCLISILLFFAAPTAIWSSFAVLLQWPSVALFFVGEYVLRRLLFRNYAHASMRQGFEAYRQNQAPPYGNKSP